MRGGRGVWTGVLKTPCWKAASTSSAMSSYFDTRLKDLRRRGERSGVSGVEGSGRCAGGGSVPSSEIRSSWG